MPISVLFWVIMIIWFFSGIYFHRSDFAGGNYGYVGGSLMLFVLLALVGWKIFGPLLR